MENNSTAAPSFWGKIGSVLADKAVDLADSYAAMKLGSTPTPSPVPQTTTAAPYVAPATPTAPNNTKTIIWIAGAGAVVLLLAALLFRPGRRR